MSIDAGSTARAARRHTGRTPRAARAAVDEAEAARAVGPRAPTVLQYAVAALATGLLLVTTLLDPQAVVLGGGLAPAGDQAAGGGGGPLATAQGRPETRLAALGDEAGRLGAALLAIDMLEAR